MFVFWNLATVLGALGATALGDPKKFGLDAAVGAAFLGLLWPRLRDRSSWVIAVVGAAVALTFTPLLSPGIPVLVAGFVAVVVALRLPTTALPLGGTG